MDTWQRDIITRNLSYFNKNLKVSTSLLTKLQERAVISEEDVQRLQRFILTDIDKSSDLMKLIQTKHNGFDVFIGTLCDPDVMQYAPGKILLEGRYAYYNERGEQQPPVEFLNSDVVLGLQGAGFSDNILPPPTDSVQSALC